MNQSELLAWPVTCSKHRKQLLVQGVIVLVLVLIGWKTGAKFCSHQMLQWRLHNYFWRNISRARKSVSSDILKLINYSCSQKPINDLHLGQVDESWYPMKHQMKHHQVFIRDETCFLSEIKHFLLFHLRRHVKTRASCFITGSKHLGLRPRAFICFSVFGTCAEALTLVFDTLLQTLTRGLKKQGTAGFLNQLWSVWLSDETLSWVFDIASQSINNS